MPSLIWRGKATAFSITLLTLEMCATQLGTYYHENLCKALEVAKWILNTNVSGFAIDPGQTLRAHLSHR